MKFLKSFPGIALLMASLFFSKGSESSAIANEQVISNSPLEGGMSIAQEIGPEAIRESFQGLDGKMLEKVLEELPPIDRVDWDKILEMYEFLKMVESAI